MATMLAVTVPATSAKTAKDMVIASVPKPVPVKDYLLVKVEAFGINRADTLQRQGGYPAPPGPGSSDIMGLEIAGTVEVAADGFAVGDRVFGLVPGGAYAEYCVIHKDMASKIPDGFTFEQAAAVPETWLTAYQAILYIAELKEGEDCLIHAGASGVGSCLIQLAKMTKARNIIVTASTNKKLEYCKSLGATHGINYKEVPNWEAKVKEITNNRGVDVIIDFVAGSYFKKNMEAAAVDCRTVMLALLGGPKVDPDINLGLMLFKRLRIQGSTLRTRSLPYQIELTKRLRKDVFPKLISGELKNVIDTVYDWKDIAKAHEHLEADKTLGKVVVKVSKI